MRVDHAIPRAARISDACEIARLAAELGYPMTSEEMSRRLGLLLQRADHRVVVIGEPAGALLAWIHVEHRISLEGGERAELMGLVVDSQVRRSGLGRVLLEAAEQWAFARGLRTITVRSSTSRELSHPFYESMGYVRSKTQHVYTKGLLGDQADPCSS